MLLKHLKASIRFLSNEYLLLECGSADYAVLKKISLEVQSPLVIVDLFVILKMSTITRESTISREIKARIDNWSTEHIHYNERFHY